MRILHVDETFHPSFGYQCNPLAKFQKKAGHDVYIIAPEAKFLYHVYKSFNENGENIEKDDEEYERISGVKIQRVKGRFVVAHRLIYNLRDLLRAIDSIHPDVVMLHCVETFTSMFLMYSLRNKYPLVFDSHMLEMGSTNRFSVVFDYVFRNTCTRLIKKRHYLVIKTQNDDYINKHLRIPESQSRFISFGTDISLFNRDDSLKKTFLKEMGLPDDSFVITSTGKLNSAKGGLLLANAVEKGFATDRTVVIVVVADFSGDYEKQVKEILDRSDNIIKYFPVQKYTDLPWFYQIADVTVFPRQCSMSFYDAQACGSPVLSETGHVNEDRNSHGNGLNFLSGSCEDFRAKITDLINMDVNEYQKMRANSELFVKQNYSYDIIAQQYTDEMVEAIKQYKAYKRRHI